MIRRLRTKRRATRKLFVERLEHRRVLDAQLGDLAGAVTSDESNLEVQENVAPIASAEGEGDPWSTFQTADQLKEFLADDAEQRWGHLFGTTTWHYPWRYFSDDTLELDFARVQPVSTAMMNVADHSQTNVQVAGVDEGDIVETDGRYLYLNGDQEIVIIDTASDLGLQVVSRVDVEGQPQAIYLADDRLSIISRPSYGYLQPIPMSNDRLWESPLETGPGIVLTVVDVANPAAPQLVSQIQVEGDLIDSRLIGNTLYLVSGTDFFLPAPETICSDAATRVTAEELTFFDADQTNTDATIAVQWYPIDPYGSSCVYETRGQYWDRLGDDWLDMVLPDYTSWDASGDVIASGLLNSPEDTYRPLTDDAARLVSVSAVDISANAPTIVTSAGAPLNWTSELYVSQQNLYVVAQTFDAAGGATSTIYQFSLDGQDQEIALTAAGQVPGRVLNQFSLDEHDDRLRIVTQQGWNASAVSGLYVLEQTGDSLDIVGQIDDLAPGERLYSVRFVGDRAFVVTFGPTSGAWYDPLFTIDLSEPTNPQVQGELEIPGFSNYLQLIDGDFLIGLGRNANETNGLSLEPQVSLFDVSDFDNPQLDGRLSFGDVNRSWSDAFNEHLAISFFPETGILAIPMNTWPRWDWGFRVLATDSDLARPVQKTQYALFVFQIDVTAPSDPIRHLGTIEHDSAIKRSLRIEDRLYSISHDTVAVHEILDPKTELDSLYYRHRAKDDWLTVQRGSENNAVEVLANDVIDADTESWTIAVTGPTARGGSVAIGEDGTTVVYTPPESFFGLDSFSYVITNADGQWDEATVEVDVQVSVQEDSQDNRLEILAGLGIGSEEPFVIKAAESLTSGDEIPMTEDGRGVRYSPSPNLYGTDRLRYEIRNELSGETSEHWLNVQVVNINDDPRAGDDHYTRNVMLPGQAGYALYLLSNDRSAPDPYENLTITQVGPTTSGGTVTISADGQRVYYENHVAQAVTDTFTYVVSDGNGGTDEATVTIDIRWSEAQIQQRMVTLAKLDLAEQLGGHPGDMDVISVAAKNWPDGCLGLGGADEFCTLAIVPGFEVTLAHETTQYVYRTNTAETVVLADTFQLEPLVRVSLEAVDQAGNPLASIEAGQSFTVNVYVKDLRDDGEGVFASYVDVFYSSRLMEVDGEITFGSQYLNGDSGSVLPPGLIDELGAFSYLEVLGDDWQLLASVPFVALRGGTASLVLNPADEIGHEVLLYGLNEAIRWDQVELVGTEIQIDGTWQNVEQPTDINDDGFTTPLDALQCVNALNSEGSRPLANPEAGIRLPVLMDVNGDRDLSPEDALLIVNALNFGTRSTDGQFAPIRPLAAWVDWQTLASEFDQTPWAPLGGVGLDIHDMLDLSHEIFANLDRDHIQAHVPGDWAPRGAAQIHTALAVAQQQPTEPLVDRLIEAADELQAHMDELDLHVVLPGIATNFDWIAAREIFRDQFFARISDAAFLDDVLD